jgi:hypothetical protein
LISGFTVTLFSNKPIFALPNPPVVFLKPRVTKPWWIALGGSPHHLEDLTRAMMKLTTHDSWDDPPSGSFFVNQYVQAERNVPRIVKESTSYVTYEMAKSLKSIVYDPIKQSFGCQFESSQIEVYAIMYTTSLQLYRRKPKSGVPNMMFSGNFYDASNPFSKSRMACSTLK